MKKKTRINLLFWVILGIVGGIWLVIGLVVHLPLWIVWTVALLCWCGVGTWILLYFLLTGKRKPHGTGNFVGNKAVYDRVSREIHEAITRYLQSVNRKGFLKHSALYERPWFLVCGPEKSGKTQLLAGSGLHFPLIYPSENDGIKVDGGSGIAWNFGNDAVWVDMPGAMMSDSNTDEWQATVNALSQVRSERAVDGVVLVVDAKRILDADPQGMKTLASSLRKRLDELIATWGIEFPVYLLVSRSDAIPGFTELFRDPAGKWNEQVLGATLSGEQQRGMPRHAFMEEFALLCSSLGDMRLRMLAKEKNKDNRRLICRFVIHFEGLEQKLGNFIAELFKPSSYEGKPVFRGFYFTSCSVDESGPAGGPDMPVNLSQTIVNHPLNPHKMAMADARPPVMGSVKKSVNAFFTGTLFSEIIPAGIDLVKKTQRFSRKETIRYFSGVAAIVVCACIVGLYIGIAAMNSISLNNQIKRTLAVIEGKSFSGAEAYRILGTIGGTVGRLKLYKDKGAPLSIGMGMYKGNRVLGELKKDYFEKVNKLIVGPSVRYLEFRIRRHAESFGELSGDDYNALYRLLKGYLSISEAVAGRLDLIDTVALRPVIFESIKYTLLSAEGKSRLSQNVEAVLNENIGLYLSFLKRGEFTLVQENQNIVAQARARLCRLPNAQILYESVINRLRPEARQVTLDELIGRNGTGILQSTATISIVYTQEGWDQSIADAIKEASKDPYKIDWVIGTTKEQMPDTDLDLDKLYAEMVDCYFQDVKTAWLAFIASVSMEPFGDIARSGRMLQKLGRDPTELLGLLNKVSLMTQIKQETDDAMQVPDALKKTIGKKTKKLQKLGMNPDTMFKRKSGTDALADAFAPLRSFVNSEGGSMSGLNGYCDKIITLAEKLSSLESLDGDNVVALFNGKESDPLYNAWKYTNNELAGMPDEMSMTLGKLLLTPVEYTGKAVGTVVVGQLNSLWQKDIVTLFTNRFAGRYPFSLKEEEAVFNDVMDFFRPHTGILWGFYDRRLSPFIVNSNNQWQVRTVGTVGVAFNQKLIETLTHAERISGIFFQPDGTLRQQKVQISQVKTNKNRAIIKMAGGEFELKPGDEDGNKAQFTWPVEKNIKETSLKIYAENTLLKDFTFSGQWGLMRLFGSARINVINKSSFIAKWQINVQNMYMIYFSCKVKVSGADHPLSEPVFNGFDVPMIIALEEKPKS